MTDWSDVPEGETSKREPPQDAGKSEYVVPVQPSVQQPSSEVVRPDVVYRDNYNANMVLGVDAGAVIALALAISSWIVLPVVGAIAALVMAPGAIRRIREANGDLGTTGVVRAAQVIAIANLAVCLLLAILIVVAIRAVF